MLMSFRGRKNLQDDYACRISLRNELAAPSSVRLAAVALHVLLVIAVVCYLRSCYLPFVLERHVLTACFAFVPCLTVMHCHKCLPCMRLH
jgi:hypothetical protein